MLNSTGRTVASTMLAVCALLSWVGGAGALTQISSCQTLSAPDTYQLTTNLSISSGDCLTVAANFVTIDLNGFAISGTGTAVNAVTDGGSALKDVAVRNGTISGLAIFLDSSTASLVDGMVIFGASLAVELGASGTVRNSTMHDNVRTVIAISGAGGTVKDNVVVNNSSGGCNSCAIITVGRRSLVSGNTLINNGSFPDGIVVGDHSTVQDNVVSHNGFSNGAIEALVSSVVVRNTVISSTDVNVVCPSTVKFNTVLGGSLNKSGIVSKCVDVGNNIVP